MAVIVSRERNKEIVSLWKHWNRCAVSTSHSHGYFTPIFHRDIAEGGCFHTYRNEIDCVINVTGKEVRFSEVGCWEGTRNRTPEVRRVLHSLLNQPQHNESKHFQRSLLQRTQNDEEHVEHNITNHIPSLQLLQQSISPSHSAFHSTFTHTFDESFPKVIQKRKTIDIISHFFVTYTPNWFICFFYASSMHFRVATHDRNRNGKLDNSNQ